MIWLRFSRTTETGRGVAKVGESVLPSPVGVRPRPGWRFCAAFSTPQGRVPVDGSAHRSAYHSARVDVKHLHRHSQPLPVRMM